MLYDLNVPWSSTNSLNVQRTIFFLGELNYSTIALNYSISGPIPAKITCAIPSNLTFPLPNSTTILRRCTLTMSDPTLNHRLPQLSQAYDILALRPTTQTAFLAACTSTSVALISLDLTVRYPFHFRPTPFMTAIKRGVKFEICYAQVLGDGNSDKRKNFISNVIAIVRATGGRGLVVSSEAKSVLGVRAQADVGNLLGVWGVSKQRATEAMSVAPRSVVVNEGINRRGFRGVIDVVDGGESIIGGEKDHEVVKETGKGSFNNMGKRKMDETAEDGEDGLPKMSKRKEKKMRLAAARADKAEAGLSKDVIRSPGTKDTPGTETA